jgi:hypothetical protein
MDFSQFLQSIHPEEGGVPDGFAVVPLPIFIMLASQFPKAPNLIVHHAVSHGPWNASLYERAMAFSAN